MTDKYNMFIGRWAPFHEGHKYIIDSFLNNGKKVCIAVRDTYIDQKNPFSADLRKKRIEEVYDNNPNVKVIVIPDIEQVAVGRGVGYSLVEAPENIQKVSGTKLRKLNSDFYNDGKGLLIWLYGLPCSGKTYLGDKLAKELSSQGYAVQRLDGDIVRKSMCKDLGFSKEDRMENVKRVIDVARTLVNHGVIVISTFITPYSQTRKELGDNFGDKLVPIWVNTSPEICEARDAKGMWAKARRGEIKNFTGVDDPFESPKYNLEPEPFVVDGTGEYEELAIIDFMRKNNQSFTGINRVMDSLS